MSPVPCLLSPVPCPLSPDQMPANLTPQYHKAEQEYRRQALARDDGAIHDLPSRWNDCCIIRPAAGKE